MNKKLKQETKIKAVRPLQRFFFPTIGVTVEAEDKAAALAKLEVGDGNI